MSARARTRYVSIRLTELEANMVFSAALAGEIEVTESMQGDPDADRRGVSIKVAALERGLVKLASARPRTRKVAS